MDASKDAPKSVLARGLSLLNAFGPADVDLTLTVLAACRVESEGLGGPGGVRGVVACRRL